MTQRDARANEADRAMHQSPARTARSLVAAPLVLAALSACAPTPAPGDAQAAVAPARAEMQEMPACRPDPALFTPPAAPDCVFGRRELKTLDPDQWARLKIEYERQCYRAAERAVRERLKLLQAATRCEIDVRR
jgi:hypothetical protein